MAKKELGPAALAVVQAVAACVGCKEPVLVACSGGADSLALALGVAWHARKEKLQAAALVVDHGLQEGSGVVAFRAAALCEEHGLRAHVRRVEVRDNGQGPEAAARHARYAALDEVAEGGYVVLGHTLDDQAETVLLGLARGSGARSLAGMPAQRDRYLRPLLGVRRATTLAACQEWGVEPWHDPHNDNTDYARVRVRQTVLPTLEKELGPGVAEALSRTALLLREDTDFLDDLARRIPLTDELNIDDLITLPAALRHRVLRRWLADHGLLSATYQHIQMVDNLILNWRGQNGADLPGIVVARIREKLVCRSR